MTLRDEPDAWPVVDSVERFRGGIVAVHTDWVRMPGSGGTETVARDRVTHPGSVAIVALDAGSRVLLVRQYRHAVSQQLWEIPAGLRDSDGEAPLDTARRELLEETGYRAGRWHTLVDCLPSPGFSDERVRIYLARDLDEVPTAEIGFERVHEEAGMVQSWLPLSEAVTAVLAGRLHNSLALVGILAAQAAAANAFAALRPADRVE
ncbi:NUDIX hydrolase [Lipingzhangella sp. LS1_29]|uniref:NUDIX hydrolase n=1 Tax=Lipingzhangella rawalii TaxID=2055835 RepID=A0ABU2H393_9ACTN|nr:NUDIX hydrolase [Lipingzhangella rawalii]MDS1269319.1 NUDIX hydrolase [Lipingzhangella rawalii]